MKELVLNAGMGDAVLARLQDFASLPTSGYVAGQAVASAVSELFGDGRAVMYNDVDVFRDRTPEEWQRFLDLCNASPEGVKSSRAIKTTQFTTLEIEEEYRRPVLSSVDRYRVIETRRRGLLNEIVCEFANTTPEKFLETFDMNCVQVGVDLESRKLIWTPEFERFNRTHELDIVRLHTPFHSLIRYFKKKAELEGVFGNDKRIVEMLAAAYYIEMAHERHGEGPKLHDYTDLRWRFGQGYREKLASVAGLILPHFSIETEVVNDYEVTHLKPRFTVDSDFCVSPKMPNIIHALPRYSRALREKHSKGTHRQLATVLPSITKSGLLRNHWLVHGEAFLNVEVSTEQLALMEHVGEERDILHHLSAPTLKEMVAKFQQVQEAVAQRGPWVYPVLVGARGLEWTGEAFAHYLDKRAKELQSKLKKPSLPVLNVNGYIARELVTNMEILNLLPKYSYRAVEGSDSRSKDARCILLTHPGNPGVEAVVHLTQCSYHRAWHAWSVVGRDHRDCSPMEAAAAKTYAHYTNLAVVLGKYPTKALVSLAPEMASALGAWIGSKVLEKIPGSFKMNLGHRLANKLDLEFSLCDAQGVWHYRNQLGYWQELAKRQAMRLFMPKKYARLAPQYAAETDDIPF